MKHGATQAEFKPPLALPHRPFLVNRLAGLLVERAGHIGKLLRGKDGGGGRLLLIMR